MKIHFKEKQQFNQWWLWSLLIIITIMPCYGLYKQMYLGQPFGDNPMSDTGLIILTLFLVCIVILYKIMTLKTIINEEKITMSFFPFITKHINLNSIKSLKVINYRFVGCWGIRLGTKYGTVYNTSGNKGLAIELHNGNKLLIGTQKEEQLTKVIKNLKAI